MIGEIHFLIVPEADEVLLFGPSTSWKSSRRVVDFEDWGETISGALRENV